MAEILYTAARELMAACVCVAAMETLVGRRPSSSGFRAVCSLAVAMLALRMIQRFMGTA